MSVRAVQTIEMKEYTISGRAYIWRELEERDVEITIENGIITEIEDAKSVEERWIFPCLFNSHTHLADTLAMDLETVGMDLSELVAPPNGLKHRLLREAADDYVIDAISESITFMSKNATAGFCDFREGGVKGVELMNKALIKSGCKMLPLILGREGGEKISDGIGISSTKEGKEVLEYAAETKRENKIVAFHAGEKNDRDIDNAIDADPDLLIHMTYASDAQLKRCVDADIPIAVCPRSNWILGVASSAKNPPIKRMLDLGCRVILGTDNVMFVQPDMFAEMSFLTAAYKVSAHDAAYMAIAGSDLIKRPFFIEKGMDTSLFVVNPLGSNLRFSRNPLKTLTNRLTFSNIERTILNP